MASIVAEPPIISPIYDNILTAYNTAKCKNFIYLMTAIHESFDQILQLRHSGHTFFGTTLTAFENELNLKTILNRIIPTGKNGQLTISDVRDFLIKDFHDDDINKASGIMGWACVDEQPLKGIEVVNPKHDLFDKWVSIIGKINPGKANYTRFLQHQDIKKHIVSLNSKNPTESRDFLSEQGFSNSIKTNLTHMLRDHNVFYPNTNSTTSSWIGRANGWMNDPAVPDDTPFDPNIHHIVFQEIATVNYSLWETSDVKESNYHLFMRGAEIISKNIPKNDARPSVSRGQNKTRTSILPHNHIYFPLSLKGLDDLHLLSYLDKNSNIYFVYNDTPNPISKINTFKATFPDSTQLNRQLYQMTTREEYKHLGMPLAQQYQNPPNLNTTTTRPPPAQIFKTTPYSRDQGLICSLCTRVIESAKPETEPDDWSSKFNGKRQSYDVDHLLNLIFNDLFNLNTSDDLHGLGFTNTCGDCNRAFKSEKIWSPSLALWELLIVKAGLIQNYKDGQYLWPGRAMEGLKVKNSSRIKKPFDGYRAFTIENIRKHLNTQINNGGTNAIETHNEKIPPSTKPDNPNKSQGITWKNKKTNQPPQTYNNNTNVVTHKNFQDIEDIFLNRIMTLIELRNNVDEEGNTTLVTKVLRKETESPGDGFAPIVSKYVKRIQLWPLASWIISLLQTWEKRVPGKQQIGQIFQNILANREAAKSGIGALTRSKSLQSTFSKAKKYMVLITNLKQEVMKLLNTNSISYHPRKSRWVSQFTTLQKQTENAKTYAALLKLKKTIGIHAANPGSSGSSSGYHNNDILNEAEKVAQKSFGKQKHQLTKAFLQSGSTNSSNLGPGEQFAAVRNAHDEFNNIEELNTAFIARKPQGDGSAAEDSNVAITQGINAFNYIKTNIDQNIPENTICEQIRQFANRHFVIALQTKNTYRQIVRTKRDLFTNVQQKLDEIINSRIHNFGNDQRALIRYLRKKETPIYNKIKELELKKNDMEDEIRNATIQIMVHQRRQNYYQSMQTAANDRNRLLTQSEVVRRMEEASSVTSLGSAYQQYCLSDDDCRDNFKCFNGRCVWAHSSDDDSSGDDGSGDEDGNKTLEEHMQKYPTSESIAAANINELANKAKEGKKGKKRRKESDSFNRPHQGLLKRNKSVICEEPFCRKMATRQNNLTNKWYCHTHYARHLRGGNKTRKNRRRKNRTKRKKSNNKNNTKKHKRRKNKTRNRR